MQEIKETQYRQQLKSRILDAAIRAFTQRGVKAVKMDDIAQSLSISKRTLYEIYGDKQQLIFQAICRYHTAHQDYMRRYAEQHNVMDTILAACRQRIEESHQVCPQFYLDIQRYPQVVSYLEQQHQQSRHNVLQFLQRGISEGHFRSDVNFDLLLHLFDALEQRIAQQQLFKRYDFRELFTTMLLVPLRGICTEQGLKSLEKAAF